MKLDYRIFWIEDKIDTVPFIALIQHVKKHLEDKFFNVHIETAEDFSDFTNIYEKDSVFDLIITDFNLNDDSQGDEIINFIRENKHISTEIFFYSANSEINEVSLLNRNRITYYRMDENNAYRYLLSEIIQLVDLTISKFEHIITMRGMIMHETSVLDVKMASIVKEKLRDRDFMIKNPNILDNVLDTIFSNAEEKYNKAKKRKLKEILKDNVLFNSSNKINALGEILKHLGQNDFSEEYTKEIISIRNQFAHAELMKNEDGVEFFKKNGDEQIIFDAELCSKIRRDIIKHTAYINEIG